VGLHGILGAYTFQQMAGVLEWHTEILSESSLVNRCHTECSIVGFESFCGKRERSDVWWRRHVLVGWQAIGGVAAVKLIRIVLLIPLFFDGFWIDKEDRSVAV
jgi:hypothetical protein